jgi:hypothetical protein
MNQIELKEVLDSHKKWLSSEGGIRADLSSANLRSANLSGANLSGANLFTASAQWTDHGECGRQLTAYCAMPYEKSMYSCECFWGDIKALRKYIKDGDEKHQKSRLCAVRFVESRMKEMGLKRK